MKFIFYVAWLPKWPLDEFKQLFHQYWTSKALFTLQKVANDSMKHSKCSRIAKGHSKSLGDDCQLIEMSETEMEAMQLSIDSNTQTEQDRTRGKDMDDNLKD